MQNLFKGKVKEDIKKNRLLSISGENGSPEISITKAGETPDFRSTGDLKEGKSVQVTLKNDLVWDVEAGEDLEGGQSVEVGEGGTVVASKNNGIGYVTKPAKKGQVAKVFRRFGGLQGPRGTKGKDGAITEKQYNDILKRLDALEGKSQREGK